MNNTAYFEAIERGDTETLSKLVAEQPDLLVARTSPSYAPERQLGCTGLHAAVYAGQPEAARVLIEAGIDIEASTTEGRTALHDSIEFGSHEIGEMLLERGANVDICAAAILGRLERVRELLDSDPDLANDRSTELSPLGWASFGNQVETARELIDRGARMDDGELLCAASVGHVEVGRLLIERGADPDAIDPGSGGNALHAAVSMKYSHDSRPFIEMLLDAGVDVHTRTTKGKTALQITEQRALEQDKRFADNPEEHRKPFGSVAVLLLEAAGY
jgi:ankyrin repeat protein